MIMSVNAERMISEKNFGCYVEEQNLLCVKNISVNLKLYPYL